MNPVNENRRALLEIFKQFIYKTESFYHKNYTYLVVVTCALVLNFSISFVFFD